MYKKGNFTWFIMRFLKILFIPPKNHGMPVFIDRRKLSHRDIKYLAQGYTHSKQQSQVMNLAIWFYRPLNELLNML